MGIFGGNCRRRCERRAVEEASMWFLAVRSNHATQLMQNRLLFVKRNRSLLHNLRGAKAIWRLLRIIIMVVRRATYQRPTGLTPRTGFLYEMLYLIWKRRVKPGLEGKTRCSALGSFFPFSAVDRERSLWSWIEFDGQNEHKSEFKK